MEDSKPADVFIEIGDHLHAMSHDGFMKDAYSGDTAKEVNKEQSQTVTLTYPNCPLYETYEINNDHYRFAYDLVETVLELRRELRPDVPCNLGEPQNYLFTQEHKNMVKSLLASWNQDKNNLLREIYPLTNGDYDYGSYVNCRDYFVEYWQTKKYTEKSFISACALIANIAAHFIQMNSQCGALDDVVLYIACWTGAILGRGTLARSHW